jgi:protoporphyrinogen oxidase
LRKFFDYPVSLTWDTLKNLGVARVCSIAVTYAHAVLFPRKPENTLEDFFINRFGTTLYRTFFRDYTAKVWGVSCNDIAAAWGAQRVKGLSVLRVLRHALPAIFSRKKDDIEQKNTDTSLIEQFLYPKFGPGQLWEKVARTVETLGGSILLNHTVTGLDTAGDAVCAVRVQDNTTGKEHSIPCVAAISSLPVRDLVRMLPAAPQEVRNVSDALVYRDFITVGLLAGKAASPPEGGAAPTIKDNWIYIQEPDVHIGRIQIFNNWSPQLVSDPDKIWMGLEYFATEGDALWEMPDNDFIAMAVKEVVALGFVQLDDVEDATLLRVKKAYPAYFGSYPKIGVVQNFLNSIPNLYPVGRNGMHRYNNMDHSMLSAMQAVMCILDPKQDKRDIWRINAEHMYHESKSADAAGNGG